MPTWLAIVIGTAAALTALGTIWRLALKPLAEMVVLGNQLLPLLKDQARVFGQVPTPWDVLAEIVEQVRTDSGSSMKDMLSRLDTTASSNASAADVLRVQVEATRQLAVEDREQMSRLLLQLDRLTVKVDAGDVQRTRMEEATVEVASDLRKSHDRADAVDATEHNAGEASDAASRSAPEEP